MLYMQKQTFVKDAVKLYRPKFIAYNIHSFVLTRPISHMCFPNLSNREVA
jgi:hypothetical protein